MYFSEREGRIRVARDGVLEEEPLVQAPTTTAGETGFLGLAVSPDGEWIYLFATEPSGDSNSVLRVPTQGGELEPILTGLPGGGYHNGGGVAFDEEGVMYVSNGETHDSGLSQDPDALGGKVYRLSAEGRPLPDNPFGPDSPTFALGLRNPYGLAIDPLSDVPFVTENGTSGHDEVNRILPSGNYGWPNVEGSAGENAGLDALTGIYHDPLLDFEETVVPTGITFAAPGNARGPYAGNMFFGAFGQRAIHRVVLDGQRRDVVSAEVLLQERDPVIALAWGPRGLYYSTPSAIKVLPLARGRGAGAAPPAPPAGGYRSGRILTALAAIALAGAAALVWRKRRGRD